VSTEHNVEFSQVSAPNLIIEVSDEALGKLGYVVIDRPVQGMTSGGVRFTPDVSPDELARLARSMTYKWAFLNVRLGGAKAGIFADPHQLGCDRITLMEAFGRSIAPLVCQQVYYPGVDLGTTMDDLRAIMRGAGRPLLGRQIDGSFCTGLTVFETIRQMVHFSGLGLSGLRIAIEGFGKVASVLAELLDQAGAKLVALSTVEGAIVSEAGLDVPRLLSLRQEYGDRLVRHCSDAQSIEPHELFTQHVDLLVPGARPYVIHADNADQIRAGLIVPISNAPLTPEAEEMLTVRGVMVIPDFVANCGGVLASSMTGSGFDTEDVRRMVQVTFADVVTSLLQEADREARPVGEIARALAWQNHVELNEAAGALSNRMARAMQVLKDQGWNGVWRRLAWRAYRRWPSLNGALRRMAVERFAEMGLGSTLARANSSRMVRDQPSRGPHA
jgi:glutamate dehydrogenase (NAD(P)+)